MSKGNEIIIESTNLNERPGKNKLNPFASESNINLLSNSVVTNNRHSAKVNLLKLSDSTHHLGASDTEDKHLATQQEEKKKRFEALKEKYCGKTPRLVLERI